MGFCFNVFQVSRCCQTMLLVVITAGLLCVPSVYASSDSSQEKTVSEIEAEQREKLWAKAMDLSFRGLDEESAQHFLRYYKKYPDSKKSEDALWRAAFLYRGLALNSPGTEWDEVMELFRSFTIEYPESDRLADAYFEVGNAYSKMHYYREAITYYGLYLKRFPRASRVNEVQFLLAQNLLQIKRFNQAATIYQDLKKSTEKKDSLRGEAGEGHIFFYQGKYHDALGIYKRILRHNPSFYVDDPDILRFLGIASIRVGSQEEGQVSLIHYLNISGPSVFRSEVLFELAESYFRQGNITAADHFYEQIISEGQEEDKLVLLSRLRLAQNQETIETKRERGQVKKDTPVLVEKEKDKPFQDVLDHHYADPLSQDARYELVVRHWQREEFDQAYILGKAYLRYETNEEQKKEVDNILGHILEKRIEALLDQHQYEEIYQLYLDEYSHVTAYQRGRLLYLIGRALESMSLWKEASIVYYRALKLSLDPDEKIELYYHRAKTYIAGNDVQSAQRLLKYLRKMYVNDPFIADVYFLSGKLRELQKRQEEALSFYQMAVESHPASERKSEFAEKYLVLLFELKNTQKAGQILDRFTQESWLSPEKTIYWYSRLGDSYRTQGDFSNAKKAYQTALKISPAESSAVSQTIHLHLGDLLFKLGLEQEAVTHLEQAIGGNDPIIKRLAQERLEEEKINKSLADLEPVLK